MKQKDIKKLQEAKQELHQERIKEFTLEFEQFIEEKAKEFPEERILPIVIEVLFTVLHNMIMVLYQSETPQSIYNAVQFVSGKISAFVYHMTMMPAIVRQHMDMQTAQDSFGKEDGINRERTGDTPTATESGEVEEETGEILDSETSEGEEEDDGGSSKEISTSEKDTKGMLHTGQERKENSSES
jgi:hypothetical protein